MKSQQFLNDDNETLIVDVSIDDFPYIKEERKDFIENVWELYVKEATRVKKVQDLYDRLFTIYQMLQTNSESLELIVGIGLLQWNLPKQAVERHMLINKVEFYCDRNREKPEEKWIDGESEEARKSVVRKEYINFVREVCSYAYNKNIETAFDVPVWLDRFTFYDNDGLNKNIADEVCRAD